MFTIVEVKTKQEAIAFLQVQVDLYQKDPNWVRPFDHEINKVFDPSLNKMFTHGTLCRWILLDSRQKAVGRVAAFIDNDTLSLNDVPVGGMGFFDCINNTEAAFMLFDQCKNWLSTRGVEAMDGSINFGARDKWWGILVDGFTAPSYGMNYNFAYYKDLFEAYGFKNYFYQYSYLRPVNMDNVAENFRDKAARVARNPDYRFEKINKKALKKVAENFRIVYNKSWVNHSGIAEMTQEEALNLMNQIKPILDDRLIYFAYHLNDPIGFYVQIPEINEVIKHLNGKFTLYHKLKFLYLLKVKKVCKRAMALIFAIVPEHRGKGVEAALALAFGEAAFVADNFQYKDIDLTWVGDFNPLMMRFQGQIGGSIYKTHATYRLYFDKNKQLNDFQRCPRMKTSS